MHHVCASACALCCAVTGVEPNREMGLRAGPGPSGPTGWRPGPLKLRRSARPTTRNAKSHAKPSPQPPTRRRCGEPCDAEAGKRSVATEGPGKYALGRRDVQPHLARSPKNRALCDADARREGAKCTRSTVSSDVRPNPTKRLFSCRKSLPGSELAESWSTLQTLKETENRGPNGRQGPQRGGEREARIAYLVIAGWVVKRAAEEGTGPLLTTPFDTPLENPS